MKARSSCASKAIHSLGGTAVICSMISFRYKYDGAGNILQKRGSLYSAAGHMYDVIRDLEYDSLGRVVLEIQRDEDGAIRQTHKNEYSADGCMTRTLWGTDLKFKRPLSTTTYKCDTAGNILAEWTVMNDKRKYEHRYTYDQQGHCVFERSEETTIEYRYNERGLRTELIKVCEQRHLSFRRTWEYIYW
jgi:hypothetical protein